MQFNLLRLLTMILLLPRRMVVAATLVIITLSACGGGGEGEVGTGGGGAGKDDGSSSISPLSSILQGRWSSIGIEPAYNIIVVPTSSGANLPLIDSLWGLAQDGSTLYKLTLKGNPGEAFTIKGRRYPLGSAAVTDVKAGSYSLAGTAGTAGMQLTLQSAFGDPVVFNRIDDMATSYWVGQANGSWRAAVGSVMVSWTVESAGDTSRLSGVSTSGCTYSGSSAVVTGLSLYKVAFTENCAGALQNFSGVATMSRENSRLTVVATNATESRAVAVLFSRQP